MAKQSIETSIEKYIQHNLRYQPIDILNLIMKQLDPASFCSFRETHPFFAKSSKKLIKQKKLEYQNNLNRRYHLIEITKYKKRYIEKQNIKYNKINISRKLNF
jgi:hypothetical protein